MLPPSPAPLSGAEERAGGSLPKPAYLPPCDGGKSAGRFTFSPPFRAKNASFCSFRLSPALIPGDAVRRGDSVRVGVIVELFFGRTGKPIYSLPSTLHANLSFHSSPTSPPYLSSKLVSSHTLSPALRCSSQKVRHALFPPRSMRAISAPLKASMVMLRTKEMWTPSPRCRPAHSRQMKVPNLGDAH